MDELTSERSDGGKAQAKADIDAYWCEWWEPPPPVTCCKHGPGDCDACGTSDRRDARHSTIGGRGMVASLRERGCLR
jgi:hypothetical protein